MAEIHVLGFPGEKILLWWLLQIGFQPPELHQTRSAVHKSVAISCGPLALSSGRCYIYFTKSVLRMNRKKLCLHQISYHSLWDISVLFPKGNHLCRYFSYVVFTEYSNFFSQLLWCPGESAQWVTDLSLMARKVFYHSITKIPCLPHSRSLGL